MRLRNSDAFLVSVHVRAEVEEATPAWPWHGATRAHAQGMQRSVLGLGKLPGIEASRVTGPRRCAGTAVVSTGLKS